MARQVLRRGEFVAACEALLVDSPGAGTTSDFHELFDILDPLGTGFVGVVEFTELLKAHQTVQDASVVRPPLPPIPKAAPELPTGPLEGLRTWMLQHNWIMQDLSKILGGPAELLSLPQLEAKLLSHIPAPWLTQKGLEDTYNRLKVCVGDGKREGVRSADFLQHVLEGEAFVAKLAARCIRVVFRELQHQRPRVSGDEVLKLCFAADANRTGVLSLPQFSSVLENPRICPGSLADADKALLFWEIAVGGSVRPGAFLEKLEAERLEFSEHLIRRALPELMKQAAIFEKLAVDSDISKSGFVSRVQLTNVLSRLELGLCKQGGLTELDDFVELFAKASSQSVDAFAYSKVVESGVWKGPNLDAAVALIKGGGIACGPAPSKGSPKAYLLPILFYKTAQGAQRLQHTAEKAFDCFDRNGKGFLSADDLRLAVADVLGVEATSVDLGLDAATKLSFPEFEKRLNFNMKPLKGTPGLQHVFRGAESVSVNDFCERLAELGVNTTTAQTWIQLICPAGVPAAGVELSCCETFLAAHTDAAPFVASPHCSAVETRECLRNASPGLRRALSELAGSTTSPNNFGGPWLTAAEAVEALRNPAAGALDESKAKELVEQVEKVSKYYIKADGTTPEQTVRAESLLACSEAFQQHVLEIRLTSVTGLDKVKTPAVSGGVEGAAELALRFGSHCADYAAETPALPAGKAGSGETPLDFLAVHTFALTRGDRLSELFKGQKEVLMVQAWAGQAGGPRQLVGITGLKGDELANFISAACDAGSSLDALLGSRAAWVLSFRAPVAARAVAAFTGIAAASFPGSSVSLSISYSRRSPAGQEFPPLPWTIAFSGRSVLCQRVNDVGTDAANWHIVSTIAAAKAVAAPPPPAVKPAPRKPVPGTADMESKFTTLRIINEEEFRAVVTRCLNASSAPFVVPLIPSTSGAYLFLRACPLPGSTIGGAWLQSEFKQLPTGFLSPLPDGDASGQPAAGASGPVTVDFALTSTILDLPAAEVVKSCQQRSVALELWLRVKAADPKEFVDAKLCAVSVGLTDLLILASPELPCEMRLRTLRAAAINPKAAFKIDNDVIAELDVSIKLELPGGPSMLSWCLPKPPEPPEPPKPPDPIPVKVNYSVKVCEVLLAREFHAPSISKGTARSNTSTSPPFFYLELSAGKGAAVAPCFRSAPRVGVEDQWDLMRVEFPDSQIVLANRPLYEMTKDSKDVDGEIRHGLHHSVAVRVVRLPGGTQCVAEAILPCTPEDGLPSPFFGGHLWLPLMHAAAHAPLFTTVGRVLISLEAETDSAGSRQLPSLPAMPTGLWLPLYGDWAKPGWNCAVDATARGVIGGDDVWGKLQAADVSGSGAVFAEDFEAALSSRVANDRDLNVELNFLRSAVSSYLVEPKRQVPYRQLLDWLVIRRLAAFVLPVAAGIFRQLRDLDESFVPATGTIRFGVLQEVLRNELARRGQSMPASLWEFLLRKPQWRLGSFSFGGLEHFDYITFFRDLVASGVSVSFSCAGPLGDDPLPPSRELVSLTLLSAHHLGAVSGAAPSTYASFGWVCRAADGKCDVEDIGSTKVVRCSFHPAWNHVVRVPLPLLEDIDGNILTPLESFDKLAFHINVRHVDQSSGDEASLGTAVVDLGPLKRGFPTIDGYFHLQDNMLLTADAAEAEAGSNAAARSIHSGQVRVVVSPLSPLEVAVPSSVPMEAPTIDASRSLPRCWAFGVAAVGAAGARTGGRGPVAETRARFTVDPAAALAMTEPSAPPPPAVCLAPWSPPERVPSVFASEAPRDAQLRALLWPHVEPFGFRRCGGVEDDVSETALRFASRLSDTELRLQSLEGTADEQLELLKARHRENLATLDRLQQGLLPPISELSVEMLRPRSDGLGPLPHVGGCGALPPPDLSLAGPAPVAAAPSPSPPKAACAAGPLPPKHLDAARSSAVGQAKRDVGAATSSFHGSEISDLPPPSRRSSLGKAEPKADLRAEMLAKMSIPQLRPLHKDSRSGESPDLPPPSGLSSLGKAEPQADTHSEMLAKVAMSQLRPRDDDSHSAESPDLPPTPGRLSVTRAVLDADMRADILSRLGTSLHRLGDDDSHSPRSPDLPPTPGPPSLLKAEPEADPRAEILASVGMSLRRSHDDDVLTALLATDAGPTRSAGSEGREALFLAVGRGLSTRPELRLRGPGPPGD